MGDKDMQHVAIMKKSWGSTDKILSGQKKIESRWYLSKRSPWDRISGGETVYFKNSGEPVKMKAEVVKVMQFADLTSRRVKEILDEYGDDDGLEKSHQENAALHRWAPRRAAEERLHGKESSGGSFPPVTEIR